MQFTTILLLLVVLLATKRVVRSRNVEVKWAEGNNRKPDRGWNEKNYYLDHKDPEVLPYGPEALCFLNGRCFETSRDKYLYRVCPFQNITMRRKSASRATLIGYWKEWSNEYTSQEYTNGQSCGGKTRTASLIMSCISPADYVAGLIVEMEVPSESVVEEGSCHHSFNLKLPLACKLLQEDIIPEGMDVEYHDGAAVVNPPDPTPPLPVKDAVSTSSQANKDEQRMEESNTTSIQHTSQLEQLPSVSQQKFNEADAVSDGETLLILKKKIDELQHAMNSILNASGLKT